MVYKLYNRRGSGGFVVEAALALTGTQYELIEIESAPSTPLPETFRDINPWRQVPALVIEDGTLMTESAAILNYLAVIHPEAALGPQPRTPAYPTFLRWLTFLSINVYEATIRRIYPERYTTNADDVESVRMAAVAHASQSFALLEQELEASKFLLGEEFTIADVYLAMLFAWHPQGKDFLQCTALTHRVAAHPVIAPIWQRNFDHRLKVKWGR